MQRNLHIKADYVINKIQSHSLINNTTNKIIEIIISNKTYTNNHRI